MPPVTGAPTRDELRSVTATPEAAPTRLSIAGGIERAACPLADPQYQDIKVTIGAVTFNNLKGATAGEMEAAWKPYAGTEQPIAILCEIRDAAGTILRNKGYLAAVQVPTQRIENGQIRLEVLYARITAIRARGETRGAERKLQEYLGHLTQGDIFDRNKAERYLLLARDLPGYNIQLTLKPAGTAPGDLIGEVSVLRQPVIVDYTGQNLSSSANGGYGSQFREQFFGVTGLGDATTFSQYFSLDPRDQVIVQAAHEFRPGSEGLTLGGQFTYAWTRPEVDTGAGKLRIDARTLYASAFARYPLQRAQRASVWLSGGFDLVNQDVTFIAPLSSDRLRVLWGRLDAEAVDTRNPSPKWRTSGAIELRQDINVLGATEGCAGITCGARAATSRADGSANATLVRAQYEYERAIGQFSLALSQRAQYAFRPVLSFEEFTAGNYTIGRGYDPGTIVGDHGLGTSLEIRGPWKALSAVDLRLRPYAFADYAVAWNRGVAGSDHLVSAGGGLRGELGARYRIDAGFAVPLERAGFQARRGNTRFLVTLTARIWPLRSN